MAPAAPMLPTARPAIWPWLVWALLLVVLDQITKQWILQIYQLGDGTPITSFFNIVRAHNTGAAFSFLADAGGWQRWLFTAIGVIATVVIVWQLHAHRGQRLLAFALSSILGGAIGNVVDRMQHGYVVDFLDFYWGSSHFPAFNLADMAISVGAVMLVVDELRRMRKKNTP
ncbi:Lipoprotein signal peptidase [compost metagenome]